MGDITEYTKDSNVAFTEYNGYSRINPEVFSTDVDVGLETNDTAILTLLATMDLIPDVIEIDVYSGMIPESEFVMGLLYDLRLLDDTIILA